MPFLLLLAFLCQLGDCFWCEKTLYFIQKQNKNTFDHNLFEEKQSLAQGIPDRRFSKKVQYILKVILVN